MMVPGPGIAKALLDELKTLRDRHVQFHTRVKAATETALARDEEVRKQNAVLKQRIIALESELKEAKGSIEVFDFLAI